MAKINEQKQFQILATTIAEYEEKLRDIQTRKNTLITEESILLTRLDAVRDIKEKWGMSAAGDVPCISTYAELEADKLKGTKLGKKKSISVPMKDSLVNQIKKIVMEAEKELTAEAICSILKTHDPDYSVKNTCSLLNYLSRQGYIDKHYPLTPEGKQKHRCVWVATDKLKEKKLRAV